MRWEVSFNTNEKALQTIVAEANSSEEAKRKAEAIAKAQSKLTHFHISFNGVRVIK